MTFGLASKLYERAIVMAKIGDAVDYGHSSIPTDNQSLLCPQSHLRSQASQKTQTIMVAATAQVKVHYTTVVVTR